MAHHGDFIVIRSNLTVTKLLFFWERYHTMLFFARRILASSKFTKNDTVLNRLHSTMLTRASASQSIDLDPIYLSNYIKDFKNVFIDLLQGT